MSSSSDARTPQRLGQPDWWLFLVTLALLSFGVVMVFDASYPHGIEFYNDKWHWVRKQITWALFGLAGLFVAMRIPYQRWKAWAIPALLVSLILLLAVKFAGHSALGGQRWIGWGPVKIQPSEFAKLGLVLFLSGVLATRRHLALDLWKGVLPLFVLSGGIILLVERQPDLGTAITMLLTVFVVLFAAGAKGRWMSALLLLCFVAALAAVFPRPGANNYRWKRVTTFLSADADPAGDAYQITHSTIALGTGGLTGLGFGESREKLRGNLPAQRTDFIFAIVGEEFGMAGTCGLMLGFLLLAARGFHVATQTKDPFGALLATGITGMVTVQALVNIAVVTASVPTTGIPLPFISYGGSSLVPTLFGIGILLNVSRRDPRPSGNRVRPAPEPGGSAKAAKERLMAGK